MKMHLASSGVLKLPAYFTKKENNIFHLYLIHHYMSYTYKMIMYLSFGYKLSLISSRAPSEPQRLYCDSHFFPPHTA